MRERSHLGICGELSISCQCTLVISCDTHYHSYALISMAVHLCCGSRHLLRTPMSCLCRFTCVATICVRSAYRLSRHSRVRQVACSPAISSVDAHNGQIHTCPARWTSTGCVTLPPTLHDTPTIHTCSPSFAHRRIFLAASHVVSALAWHFHRANIVPTPRPPTHRAPPLFTTLLSVYHIFVAICRPCPVFAYCHAPDPPPRPDS